MKSILFLLFPLSLFLHAAQGASVGKTKAELELWIETRQLTSEEKNDWLLEKAFLIQSEALLKGEVEALDAKIKGLKDSNTSADEAKAELVEKRQGYYASNTVLESKIVTMEKSTLALIKRLPVPLKKKLERLIVRIPENPSETKLSLGQRLQNVVGILAQAEKFDKTANFAPETRELENGKKVQVRTLYWGLSSAYYVDTLGQKAGVGTPGEDGWTWTEKNEIAHDVKHFMDIYEGNTDAIEFVSLPISLK